MIVPGDIEPIAPIPFESLDGYAARVSAENRLDRVSCLTQWAAIGEGHRPHVSTKGWYDPNALAEVLQVDLSEVTSRTYTPVDGSMKRMHFFGTTVHRSDLHTRIRKFSPKALAMAPFHRALWQLRIPFDIETGELLRSTCPSCGLVQRWRVSIDIDACDECVHDLTSAPMASVPEELLPKVRLAVGLTHPDPHERAKSLAALPHDIAVVGAAEAFELLIRLTPVIDPDLRWGADRIWGNDPIQIAHAMDGAWDVLASWPDTFYSLALERMIGATRRHSDGNKGATIRFLKSRNSPHISGGAAEVIRQLYDAIDLTGPNAASIRDRTLETRAAGEAIGLSTARVAFFRRKGALANVLIVRNGAPYTTFDRAEIAQIVADMANRFDLNFATQILGVPFYGLEQMVAMNQIAPLSHPYFAARYDEPQVDRRSVVSVATDLEMRARRSASGAIPLKQALHLYGGDLKPWGSLMGALLSRSAPLPFALSEGDGPIAERICVSESDFRAFLKSVPTFSARAASGAKFTTKRDAAEILNISQRQLCKLFPTVKLSSARNIPIAAVITLAEEYIALSELQARTGQTPKEIFKRLRGAGISRESPAGYARQRTEELFALLSR